MTKGSLIGTALAAALMASPGVALAQSGNTNTGNGNAWNSQVGNSYTNQNQNWHGRNASRTQQEMRYGDIGHGSYTGAPMPIMNKNGNSGNNSGNSATRPSQRNPLLADNGDARASKVIGTNVFNQRDQQLGSVNDILIGRNGVYAIISTNNKKVAVPFQALVFGDANRSGDDKLVLPNATQAQLNAEPVIHYNATNYSDNNNSNGKNGNNSNGGGGWFGNNYNSGNNGLFSGGSTAHNSSGNNG